MRTTLGFAAIMLAGIIVWKTTSTSTQSGDVVVNSPTVEVTTNVVENAGNLNIKLLDYTTDRIIDFNEGVTRESSNALISKLKALDDGKRVLIKLNSPGGSVFDGSRVLNQMEVMKGGVDTLVDGMCASMCAIIHQHGQRRYMTNHSLLMFHPASGGANGQVPNMLSRLNVVDKVIKRFEAYIVSRSKIEKLKFKSLVGYELWVDAIDALQMGFIESVAYSKNAGIATSESFEDKTKKRILWDDIQYGL